MTRLVSLAWVRSTLLLAAGALFTLAGTVGWDLVTGSGAATPAASAQGRAVEVQGHCNRGNVLVSDGSSGARCVELSELIPRCGEGEFLSTSNRSLQCIGGARSTGARGLLPTCSRDLILVSQGFGRWDCEPPPR